MKSLSWFGPVQPRASSLSQTVKIGVQSQLQPAMAECSRPGQVLGVTCGPDCSTAIRRNPEVAQKINQAGLNLIKDFEGFRSEAYLDAVGIPTIGYGHTGTVNKRDVSSGRSITMAEAERLLREDLAIAEAGV